MFSNSLLNGLYIIPILGVLIFVHEVGHFVAARLSGVKVEEFGIGIPPRITGFMRNGVLWSINWIPFGGFVRVKGEDGEDMSPDSMSRRNSGGLRSHYFATNSLLAHTRETELAMRGSSSTSRHALSRSNASIRARVFVWSCWRNAVYGI